NGNFRFIKMSENQQSQVVLLQNALKATKELRTSVQNVFGKLCDGMEDGEDQEKTLLNDLQQSLMKVNTDLGELEKMGSSIQGGSQLVIGNTSYLSLDPVVDKTPAYTQLLQSYKWSNKVSEHAGFAHALLHQNSLKRSHLPSSGQAKRLRKHPPTIHTVPEKVVDTLVANLDQMFPDMSLTLSRPLGASGIIQVTLSRTLKAVVVLRGLLIESVIVRGYGEEMYKENGKLDIWRKSKHAVFNKITENASAAMLHFYAPLMADIAVKSFLTWLHSYKKLFSTLCVKCNKYLVDNLPPTWRDLRNLDPYHESCRP
ncbi:unnamed protein product, partial [Owenia fusiformis]